jgi:very-short-patch-repair endonuclease
MVSRAQLLAAGFDGDAIAYRVRAGRLHPRHRGVYAVGHVPVSPLATAMGAVLACGDGAVLSHRSAGALWRILPRWPRTPDVTTRAGRPRTGIHVHRSRTLTPQDVTHHYGIPVTTPNRTLLDLTETLPDRELIRAQNEAYVLKLTTPPALATFLTRNPGRPTSRLTVERSATAAPTRSHLEDDFLRFLRRHDLPPPELNQRIAGYEVDAVWRDKRLIAELDGYTFHATPSSFESDRERDATLLTAGFSTLRITHRRLTHEPEREAARLRRLLA